MFRIGQPLCLGQLLRYFNPESDMSVTSAYLYATGVLLCTASPVITYHLNNFKLYLLGMQMRVATCSLIYRKSLKLSQKALGETSVGQMVNLMSNDVNRFDVVFSYLNDLWVGPVQVLITSALLYHLIGFASLIGLAAILLFGPFQCQKLKSSNPVRDQYF